MKVLRNIWPLFFLLLSVACAVFTTVKIGESQRELPGGVLAVSSVRLPGQCKYREFRPAVCMRYPEPCAGDPSLPVLSRRAGRGNFGVCFQIGLYCKERECL